MSARAATAATQKSAAPVLTAAPAATVQRQCDCGQHAVGGECEECKKKHGVLSRAADGPFSPRASFAGVREALASPGQPLDRDTRTFMEERFGRDFSGVRVHTSEHAAASARVLHARAWALGDDVVFASGSYSPRTAAGRHLLAHELAHVVQQRHAGAAAPGTALTVSEPGDASEREADVAARRVTAGGPAPLREHDQPGVIHRDTTDTLKGIGIGLGVAGGIAGLIYLLNKLDASRVENPPQCGSKQLGKIKPAVSAAIQWTKTSAAKLAAFQSAPAAPENQYVRDRLQTRFRSDSGPVVQRIRRVVVQIADRLESPQLKFECHTADSDQTCGRATAFVPGLRDVIVFCPKFYHNSEPEAIIVHEMAHTLGAEISDRGYERERIFGGRTEPTRLSTEEALGNAESYANFVGDLVEGKPYGKDAIQDEIDCPDDWKEDVKDAIAQSHRATLNVVSGLINSMDRAGDWKRHWDALSMPGGRPTADAALQAYRTTEDKLASAINVNCKSKPGSTCDRGDVEWTSSTPPTFVLCPVWKNRPPDQRAVNALAGLLGMLGGVSQDNWRTGMARIAFEMLRTGKPAPTKEEVFGSPDWSPDLIGMAILMREPDPQKGNYRENGILHERLSRDVPVYRGKDCGRNQLPFVFRVLFRADEPGKGRPSPYPPLKGSIEYAFTGGEPKLHEKREDGSMKGSSPGAPLRTTLSKEVKLGFDTDGTFEMTVRLEDPETGTVRVYGDRIEVRAVRHCPEEAPAGSPAAPAGGGEE